MTTIPNPSIPNPSIMARFAPKPAEPVTILKAVTADLEPTDPGKIVRPGMRRQIVEIDHDGVIKAKHVEAGQIVQAYLHGAPRGGQRTVYSVTHSEDGATVVVEFSSAHPTTEYKAAYRFFVAALVGTTVRHSQLVPALVTYEEA